MKIVRIIFLIVSIVLFLLLGYSIINMYVSLKYEIDEWRVEGVVPYELARFYMLQYILTLKEFLIYVIVTIAVLIGLHVKKRKKILS